MPSVLGIYGHGGAIFLLITSTLFTLIYLVVYLLPYTSITNVISIPVKPSFYRYALVLFCNCLLLTIGSVLVLSPLPHGDCGYCLINIAHYLYFSFFIPFVYLIFINEYCYQPAKFPFSYTMNESMYEDNGNSIDSTNTFMDDDENFMHHSRLAVNGQLQVNGDGVVAGCSSNNLGDMNNFTLNGPVYTKVARTQDQINYHRFLYNTNIQSPDSLTGYSSVEESTAHGSMEFIQPQNRQGDREQQQLDEEATK